MMQVEAAEVAVAAVDQMAEAAEVELEAMVEMAQAEEGNSVATSWPLLSAGFDRILEHVHTSLLNETPTAFGLHPNAEVAFRTESGQVLLQSMLLLTTKEEDAQENDSDDEEEGTSGLGGGSAAKETADAVQLAAEGVLQDVLENYRDFRFDIQELFFKGSSDSGQREGGSRRSKGGSVSSSEADDMDPFQTVLLQECQRINHLLQTMTDSLSGWSSRSR